ncbi:MAG: IniB N-terminal domain-containing protein [Actinomycetota bacterium]|nr:IniB N-terminal domain-containing protein [Actinomycetota bacterium]
MSTTQSLLDFILNLMRDGDAKAAFAANPDQALADAGLSDVLSGDVSDAMSYVAEYHPVSYVGDGEYNVGNTRGSHHDGDHRPDDGYRPDSYEPVRYQPDPHATAVQQLEYITNNYSYADSHDTMIDKSVNQNIWNKGDLSQSFTDNSVTATDHSVAAGHNINGDVANGNDNVVGDNTKVGNTDNSQDHSIHGSFNSTNNADNGGVAGDGAHGNVTQPYQSTTATDGSGIDQSTHHTTTAIDSGNTTDVNYHPDNSVSDSGNTTDLNYHPDNSVDDSYNHKTIEDNHVHQEGLVNVNDVLSHDHLGI